MANDISFGMGVSCQHDYRCKYCKKILFKHNNRNILEIEIKCSKCGKINTTHVDPVA